MQEKSSFTILVAFKIDMEDEVLTLKELSVYLKCSISTIRNLVRKKAIPHFRIGSKIYFKKTKIESWIDKNEQ